jgi:DNA-binding NarL/FixJ family response regulator
MMGPLDALSETWLERVRGPRQRAAMGALGLVVLGALLFARQGSLRARLIATAFIGLPVLASLLARHLEHRAWKDPARVIRRVAGGVDEELAGRAVRALTLLDPEGTAAQSGISEDLARLHVARAMAALPRDRVTIAAESLGRRFATLALVLAVGAAALFAGNAWRVMEGLDVLTAMHGNAPVDVTWFEDVEVTSRPPDYLHEEERKVRAYGAVSLPRGSLITVRGTLAHPGRTTTLSDGSSEIPFVDDGSGRVIARWPLAESVNLRVVVRFGEVTIREPSTTRVTSIADLPPSVVLEGAPRKVMLASAADDGTIPIRYEAQDDHGLREVELVLRSGVREERRLLARLDGETKVDRGGHVLRANDAFIKKSHGPVEVTVEAKDNDPITGPKWGASAPIVVVPPDVGEPEARRLDALRKLRDAFVDALAFRMSHDIPTKAKERAALITQELHGDTDGQELLEATLTSTYAGLRIPVRLQAMLKGQAGKVHEAMNQEAQAPSSATHSRLIGATERLVLVIDAVVRGLGQKDTRAACKQLADVADDLALGASQMQRPADRQRGTLRMDASTHVLEGGARSIVLLGMLGRDLGEIVTADLSRVGRARKDDDLVHAEIAARDLAARLHEPDPSFGSRGRTGGRAGGESGGGRGTPGEDAEGGGDDAEQAFNMAAQELDRLAMDHATAMGKVEQAIREGTSEEEMKELSGEAKKHAAAVRDAVSGLPTVSAGSDSWTSKGSAARDQAEAMARALERGDPAEAASSGKTALDDVDEAKRNAEREKWRGLFAPPDEPGDHTPAGKRLTEARKKLEPEVKWAEEQIAKLRKKAAENKAGELSDDADEERKLGERAGQLGREGKDRLAMPGAAIDSLEEAERSAQEAAGALRRGDVDHGLERQREAQHQLEMAKAALGGESGESGEGASEGADGDRDSRSGHVDIPKADASKGKGAEQFRRRVLKGLSESAGGRQRDAVRRYAEGLLR